MRDKASLWHPFTQMQTAKAPVPILAGVGAYLHAATGEKYLDAISSWWVNLHGHAHPYIAQKIAEQASLLEHVLFAGYTHPQAIVFAERLLKALPPGFGKVFYSDNGSTAVEAALKMALQASGSGKKLLSFEGAYHGDTFGAMAAAGKTAFNRPFWPYLFEVVSIEPPITGSEEKSWQTFIASVRNGDIAAFIYEPLMQGAGGMRPYCRHVLARMLKTCEDQGIITIADEVMTGFGRTGNLFASSSLPILPDLLCLSKGITGGFLPLGATVAKERIFEAFLAPDEAKAFLHGHSYMANPIACAAANTSLDLLLQDNCLSARKVIEKEHQAFQSKWQGHPKIKRCDVVGTILALEYKAEKNSYFHPLKERLKQFFQQEGILLRPLGNVLYVLPPYCITSQELERIYAKIAVTLEEWQ